MNNLIKIITLCGLMLAAGGAGAQSLERSVLGTLGGSISAGGSGPQLMQNMGEVATATLTGSSNALTQGFEQPGSNLSPISGTLAVCAGSTTALADGTPGGTWSSSNTAIATVGTTGLVTGVTAGMATISYSAGGSVAVASVTVNALPVVTLTATGTVCGGSGGTVTTTVAGGTPGYSYMWSNGATTAGITGLALGVYSVTVTDARGCAAANAATVSAGPRTVTVRLVSSTGAGLAGGVVQYYNGGWLPMGTTDTSGRICMSFPTPAFSESFITYFRVLYAGGQMQWSGIAVASSPVLTATTTNVSLCLRDHTGALITSSPGVGGYYPGAWTTIGSTGGTGRVNIELLPGAYYFNMNYNNYTAQQNVTIGSGPNQDVNFQTTLVKLNLMDHSGAPITSSSGTGGYYSGGWYTMGSTGTTGSVSMELLQGSGYYFNMNYHNYTQQQAVTVGGGPVQNVNFQTTLVTLNLRDHTGALITAESGTGGYYSGGWYTMGSTGSTGMVSMELLPGSGYYFNMAFHNYTQQQAVTVTDGPTQSVNFQTTLVTLNLRDHTGALITAESGTGGYYSGAWYTMGSTGTTGMVSMELLSGSGYYFNMAFHNYTQQQAVTVTSGPTQSVNFQTTLVTLNLRDHTGALITAESGTGGYYSGGWYTMGSTGSTGMVSMELLPGPGYYFNMAFHNYTQQQAVTVTGGPTQSVNFQTTLVTLNLRDHTGALITAESGTGGYYSGSWYTMGSTGTMGMVSMELLPGSGYYVNMNFHNYTQQQAIVVTTGPTQNVTFQTTLVSLYLFDHASTAITAESGTGGYYTSGWHTMGSTGTMGNVSIELLPGTGYYFNMNFHNGTQQLGAITVIGEPWIQNIRFQTALVTVHYQHSSGTAIPGASIGYYSGGWYVMGTSDVGGNSAMEMLPVPYYYNASIVGLPTVQVGPFTDAAAGTPTHVITASGVGAKAGHPVEDGSNGAGSGPDKIGVYPNPTSDLINVVIPVKYTEAVITVTDLSGQIVQEQRVTANTGAAVTLSLGNVARGMYLVKVNAGDVSTVVRLVVQ